MADVTADASSFIIETDDDPAPTAARDRFFGERIVGGTAMIERAVARGELPADTDARLLIEQATGPIYFRLLLTGEPVDSDLIRRIAHQALHGPTPAA